MTCRRGLSFAGAAASLRIKEADPEVATDLLRALLAFETRERLTRDCVWSRGAFVSNMTQAARAVLVAG